MKRDELMQRGQEAKALRENPMLAGAFAAIRRGAVDALERGVDPEGAYRMAITMQVVHDVEVALFAAVANGDAAAEAIVREGAQMSGARDPGTDYRELAAKARAEYEQAIAAP